MEVKKVLVAVAAASLILAGCSSTNSGEATKPANEETRAQTEEQQKVDSATADYQVYDGEKYSIKYPRDWKMEEEKDLGFLTLMSPEVDRGNADTKGAVVVVLSEPLEEGKTFEESIEELKKGSATETLKASSVDEIKINGLKGYKAVVSDDEMRADAYLVEKNGIIYMVMGSAAEPAQFDQYSKQIETIAHTIVLKQLN